MGSRVQIDQVETAIIALGLESLLTAYGVAVDVDSIGDRDFDDNGDLVLSTPAVRVRFGGASYEKSRDNQKLTYQAGVLFDFWCFEENLRSKHDERLDTLKLVTAVLDVYVGARLLLDDGSYTEPTEALGVVPAMKEGEIVDQFYIVTLRFNGLAQFGGMNAKFGEKS